MVHWSPEHRFTVTCQVTADQALHYLDDQNLRFIGNEVQDAGCIICTRAETPIEIMRTGGRMIYNYAQLQL